MLITDRLQAAMGSLYRLERELGMGGMATVFLATDLKHGREVAIKVLRSDLAAVLGAERFLAEVKLAASLDHPHILTLIDSGESNGILYYVMPFVRGESLRTRLEREKQLGIDDALTITKQVASALDYAHAKGVIHRDIKPENILIHHGEAVLADFGIALAVKEAGGDRLTETGLSLGTPRYMSPEQATGDRTLDARSDVYSLAAVLYEMLGGETPVTGATAQAMIAKLLTEKPSSLRVVRDTVTPALDAAVLRGLSKVPADRFASAGGFAQAAELAMKPGAGADAVAHRRSGFTGRRVALLAAAAVLVVAAGAGAAFALRRGAALPFAGAVMTPLTTSGRAQFVIPSPDGKQIAYMEERCDNGICRGDLMIRELNGDGIATIAAEPNVAFLPTEWSPDGRWVLMGTLDLEKQTIVGIQIVPQRGGVPRSISGTTTTASFVAADTLVVLSHSGPPFWIRRLVASTGAVIDSVRAPFTRNGFYSLSASPSGAWLMARRVSSSPTDPGIALILDRAGRPTDTIDIMHVWDASKPASLLLSEAMPTSPGASSSARALLSRPLNRQGKSAAAETLATHESSARFNAISADGAALFFDILQTGETTRWTATRPNVNSPFVVGRVMSVGVRPDNTPLSPRGGWIVSPLHQVAASGPRRLEVEPFAGGPRVLLDAALMNFRDIAFSPRDDSIAVIRDEGRDGVDMTVYPLPSGSPIHIGALAGRAFDLEWLSDGRFASPLAGGRVVRVYGRSGTSHDFAFPDSLGVIVAASRSPTSPELALLSDGRTAGKELAVFLTRMDMTTGKVTMITRVPALFGVTGQVWWSTDAYVRFVMLNPVQRNGTLVRVPVGGGPIEAELPLTFAPNGMVNYLSHDGLRAIVSAVSSTSNVAVMRTPEARR